jgi:hypothetical protein
LAALDSSSFTAPKGLYRPFVEHAWSRLQESGLFEAIQDIPVELQSNEAPAKGNVPNGTVVRMETAALRPKNNPGVVSYARYALLETIVPSSDTANATTGIQVMNLVVFPSKNTDLPVWGVDLVSLPGDKHLLAMDAQPMTQIQSSYEDRWKAWYEAHVQNVFEWGGDIPEAAEKFFSKNALWTRLQGQEAIPLIQDKVFHAFCDHLECYLQLLSNYELSGDRLNHQAQYLTYRLQNDPARPMLQSLYGPEWTERVLEEVLFPENI